MFCETCFLETEPCVVDGHEACSMCGQETRGGPSVHTSTYARKAARPDRIHKSVSSALVARGVSDAVTPSIARVAQRSVAAAFAGGRAPSNAARALANRAVDEVACIAQGEALERAEALIGAREPCAYGKADKAAELLRVARARGACRVTPKVTDGAWALAAIVAATFAPPPKECDYESTARDAAYRCDVPFKSVCVPAIVELWKGVIYVGGVAHA